MFKYNMNFQLEDEELDGLWMATQIYLSEKDNRNVVFLKMELHD